MTRTNAVARELERQIVAGERAIGERLPAEPELALQFGVSRTTIRGAVSELQARGLLSREQGRGTFVRGSGTVHVNMLLEANLSVTDVIRGSGRRPGTTGLSVNVEFAPASVVAALRLPLGSRCLVVRRTRTADGVPTTDSTDYLLLVPSLPHTEKDYEHSVYELLEDIHRRPVSSGTARIEATLATGDTAARLDVPEGSAILMLSQVHELSDGTPVMYSVISLRSDVVNLNVHRRGRDDGSLHESEIRAHLTRMSHASPGTAESPQP